jgi:hypothetical protein
MSCKQKQQQQQLVRQQQQQLLLQQQQQQYSRWAEGWRVYLGFVQKTHEL